MGVLTNSMMSRLHLLKASGAFLLAFLTIALVLFVLLTVLGNFSKVSVEVSEVLALDQGFKSPDSNATLILGSKLPSQSITTDTAELNLTNLPLLEEEKGDTSPFPDTVKDDWVIKYLVTPHRRDNMVEYSYEVYADQQSKDLNVKPFLISSHKSQIRENTPEGEHQRILKDGLGALLHISGEHVQPEDIEDFLENDLEAYRWVSKSDTRWTDDRGRSLAPFLFPTYDGVLEALDPQWERERFSLLVATQIDEYIDQYLLGAEIRKLDGDHRGTTIDAQVGAGVDDGYTTYNPVTDFPGTPSGFAPTAGFVALGVNSGGGGTLFTGFFRFTGISGLSGQTIDVSYLSLWGQSAGTGTPETVIHADDAAAPAAPTTKEEHDGDPRTTAGVTWDNLDLSTSAFTNSPSINTVIQELADTHDPTVIQILQDGDLLTDSANFALPSSYEEDTTEAAKIHIEHSAGGGGGPTAAYGFWFGSISRIEPYSIPATAIVILIGLSLFIGARRVSNHA